MSDPREDPRVRSVSYLFMSMCALTIFFSITVSTSVAVFLVDKHEEENTHHGALSHRVFDEFKDGQEINNAAIITSIREVKTDVTDIRNLVIQLIQKK